MSHTSFLISALRIKKASLEDAPAIARIHLSSWQYAYRHQFPKRYLDALSLDEKIAQWTQYFKHKGEKTCSLYLALNNEQPVGFISFGPGRDSAHAQQGEIYALYLIRTHWGKGIGHTLFKKAAQKMSSDRAVGVYLWALDSNKQALHAYQKWGGEVRPHIKRVFTLEDHPFHEVYVTFPECL